MGSAIGTAENAVENIEDAIGNTPLLKLDRSLPAGCASVYAKLERFNPNGSQKDRLVAYLLREAESVSKIRKGDTLVTATSGNSGISLAAFGNIKGYPTVIVMPDDDSLEKIKILQTYGATVVLTPADQGIAAAEKKAKELTAEKKAFFVDVIEAKGNFRAYEKMTDEIADSFSEDIHAVVVACGTGTTLTAMAKRFRKAGTRIIAVRPSDSPHKIRGLGLDMDDSEVRAWIDDVVKVTDAEAYEGSRDVAKKEGFLIGLSGGAAFAASRRVAQALGPGKNVITIFPDGGERYFSLQKFF